MVLKRDPWWKQLLMLLVVFFSVIYSLPNLYGEDPSVQISSSKNQNLTSLLDHVKNLLQQSQMVPLAIESNKDQMLLRFKQPDVQLKAKELLTQRLGNDYTVALNLASATPAWLRWFGAKPMKLGLDLRGGVHFLLEVDVTSILSQQQAGLLRRLGESLRNGHIKYQEIHRIPGETLQLFIRLEDGSSPERALELLQKDFPDYQFKVMQEQAKVGLVVQLGADALSHVRQRTMDQTLTILRNRVNELGISEAIVQQQGPTRIVVDLPGVQDTARAKEILGGTATLEFRLVEPKQATPNGAPLGSKIYYFEDGSPILLKNQVVLSGNSITSANASYSNEGYPAVFVTIGGSEVSSFNRITTANIGKRMAIVYVQSKVVEVTNERGEKQRQFQKVERVLSAPEIRSALGNNFQITGIGNPKESSNLALMLRSGALLAPIDIVEERTIGPSMGEENIKKGLLSMKVGMALVVLFMLFYYSLFGFIADIALFLNLLFLTALLSIFGATLTLPGIAAIVLTIGMAVDANVLIYERIREELREGNPIQASIVAGFERAFDTILDSNLSSLIVGMVLFSLGTSAVKGFAINLCLGLLTSMFTSVTFSRALVKWIYGGQRPIQRLHIGI